MKIIRQAEKDKRNNLDLKNMAILSRNYYDINFANRQIDLQNIIIANTNTSLKTNHEKLEYSFGILNKEVNIIIN